MSDKTIDDYVKEINERTWPDSAKHAVARLESECKRLRNVLRQISEYKNRSGVPSHEASLAKSALSDEKEGK